MSPQKVVRGTDSNAERHVVRDLVIARQLEKLADVEIDWIAPWPAADFLAGRGRRVLACSARLGGSGRAYERVFADCREEFNLMDYIRAETKLHKHDFRVSSTAWKEDAYAVLVGDEAFWLLSDFASRWGQNPAPFVFLTFIAVPPAGTLVKVHPHRRLDPCACSV